MQRSHQTLLAKLSQILLEGLLRRIVPVPAGAAVFLCRPDQIELIRGRTLICRVSLIPHADAGLLHGIRARIRLGRLLNGISSCGNASGLTAIAFLRLLLTLRGLLLRRILGLRYRQQVRTNPACLLSAIQRKADLIPGLAAALGLIGNVYHGIDRQGAHLLALRVGCGANAGSVRGNGSGPGRLAGDACTENQDARCQRSQNSCVSLLHAFILHISCGL